MIKKILPLFLFAFLLVGCNNNQNLDSNKEYKNKLRYSFIKGKVAVIVEYVIRRYTLYNVNYYYSESENCIYIKVYDVIFSFHNIPTEILEYEDVGKQKKIEWSGIRLQRIAQPLFLLASELIEGTLEL